MKRYYLQNKMPPDWMWTTFKMYVGRKPAIGAFDKRTNTSEAVRLIDSFTNQVLKEK